MSSFFRFYTVKRIVLASWVASRIVYASQEPGQKEAELLRQFVQEAKAQEKKLQTMDLKLADGQVALQDLRHNQTWLVLALAVKNNFLHMEVASCVDPNRQDHLEFDLIHAEPHFGHEDRAFYLDQNHFYFFKDHKQAQSFGSSVIAFHASSWAKRNLLRLLAKISFPGPAPKEISDLSREDKDLFHGYAKEIEQEAVRKALADFQNRFNLNRQDGKPEEEIFPSDPKKYAAKVQDFIDFSRGLLDMLIQKPHLLAQAPLQELTTLLKQVRQMASGDEEVSELFARFFADEGKNLAAYLEGVNQVQWQLLSSVVKSTKISYDAFFDLMRRENDLSWMYLMLKSYSTSQKTREKADLAWNRDTLRVGLALKLLQKSEPDWEKGINKALDPNQQIENRRDLREFTPVYGRWGQMGEILKQFLSYENHKLKHHPEKLAAFQRHWADTLQRFGELQKPSEIIEYVQKRIKWWKDKTRFDVILGFVSPLV